MQSPQQKQLENLIQSIFACPQQNILDQSDQMLALLKHRVDMPKHFISILSKHFATKDCEKLQKLFDMLWFATEKYQNKVAFFNQVSANKQFLFKISSILSIKDMNQSLKRKIIDIVYEWKQMFKSNRELFPNFWTFYNNFQKKGYSPSNLNFQTRYQQPQINPKEKSNQSPEQKLNANIFDLIERDEQIQKFDKIQKPAILLFKQALSQVLMQNKIISNTSPQILDFPPILKESMAQLKRLQDKINKFIGQNRAPATVETATNLIKAIHTTEKRYTQLITRYLPKKFQLTPHLIKFSEFLQNSEQCTKENISPSKQLNLLDLGTEQKSKTNDLLDLDKPEPQPQNQRKNINNFFGNLLNKVNAPKAQQTNSSQPIQNQFKTDLDFMSYKDPKSIKQYFNDFKGLTAQQVFKF